MKNTVILIVMFGLYIPVSKGQNRQLKESLLQLEALEIQQAVSKHEYLFVKNSLDSIRKAQGDLGSIYIKDMNKTNLHIRWYKQEAALILLQNQLLKNSIISDKQR